MTGAELLTDLRARIDDEAVPHLWSDPELMRYLNYAQIQACRRSQLIVDGTTSSDLGTSGTAGTSGGGVASLCSVTIIPNVGVYALSRLVLQIKRVKLATMAYPLAPITRDELDATWYDWEALSGTNGTSGTSGSAGDSPVYPDYFLSETGNELKLIKIPTINDTASLVIVRLPLQQFTIKTSPEIEEKHHDGLIDWAAHLAYMKPDSETMQLNLAAVYEKKFTERFGPIPDAYAERMRKELPRRQRMRARGFGD